MGDEGVLFEGLRLGSRQAFEELLRAEDATMRRLAGLYVPEEQVDALVRQAWSVALPGLDMFTWHTTFRAWLTGILVSYGRARCTQQPAEHPVPAATADHPVTSVPGVAPAAGGLLPWASLRWSRLWSSESWTVLEDALAALPLPQQEVLWLHDVEAWSWREVLDTLGLTAEQGADLRHTGRAALAAAVAEHVGAGPAARPAEDDERLAGVAALLSALRPTQQGTSTDPRLVRTFTAWRRHRGVRPWRRWWWELDRARARLRGTSARTS